MREIKFRYVLRDRVTEETFDRFLILNDLETGLEVAYDFDSPRFIDCELVGRCEYTGLKDKNGREIYEEDITRDDDGFLWKIYWEDGSFWAKGGEFNLREQLIELAPDFCEIIGDVYRNPELLEAAE